MNYITNGSHIVHCREDTSKRLYVIINAPQAPLLFILYMLYINDISQSIVNAFINMFADTASL